MKKPIIFIIMLALAIMFICPIQNQSFASAENSKKESTLDLKISAKSCLLLDYRTGTILYDKNPDEKLPIASMTKLATLAVVFDAIEKGAVKENDFVIVSKNASSVGGSSAFLDAGSSYKVSELVKTIIIASANDSSVAIAEHIAGSEELFVSKMNKYADCLGLKNTNFKNVTGLPIEGHYSTANDIAKIYQSICNNQIYKRYSKLWMEDFIHPSGRKTGLVNTNKLIKTYEGIEGGKTGFTNAARFCLTASASRGNIRLVGVVIGANDSKTRFNEMTKLFNYGFSNFDNKLMANKDVAVSVSEVKKTEKKLEVFPKKDVSILIDKNANKTYSVEYKIDEIIAPAKAGDVVGKLFVFDENNMVVEECDLIIKEDVFEISIKEHLKKIINAW